MNHNQIWKTFTEKFPRDSRDVDTWFPCGKDTIRIRMTSKKEFVFRMTGPDEWDYMPIKTFIKQMKGDKRM